MPRFIVTLRGGACGPSLPVAISLVVLLTGCGRLGFETAGDAEPRDAGVRDVGVDAEGDTGCGPPLDLCVEIPRLLASPTIDGVREACVPLVTINPEGWTGVGPIPSGIAMRAAIAWRPEGLYVFVEVDDPDRHPALLTHETFCGDGLEIYVDDDGTFAVSGAYDQPGTVQLIATAPATDTSTVSRGALFVFERSSGVWPSDRFAVRPTPSGYSLETLVVASDLGLSTFALATGQRVGLDLSLNVSTADGTGTGVDPCGRRLGQYFARVVPAVPPLLCGQPYCDSRAFCTPILR